MSEQTPPQLYICCMDHYAVNKGICKKEKWRWRLECGDQPLKTYSTGRAHRSNRQLTTNVYSVSWWLGSWQHTSTRVVSQKRRVFNILLFQIIIRHKIAKGLTSESFENHLTSRDALPFDLIVTLFKEPYSEHHHRQSFKTTYIQQTRLLSPLSLPLFIL